MIKETKNDFKVVKKTEKAKYKIDKKSLKISLYDDELITNIIAKKFNKKYKDILYLFATEDDSSENAELILLKLDDLTNILLNKYSKYLNKYTLKKYLNMINLLKIKLDTLLSTRGKSR